MLVSVTYFYQLTCRGKTTGLSSEPAKWSCDYCRRTSDLDSYQFILIRMDYKVSISARSNVTSDISLYKVCVGWGGRTLRHKQFSSDG